MLLCTEFQSYMIPTLATMINIINIIKLIMGITVHIIYEPMHGVLLAKQTWKGWSGD